MWISEEQVIKLAARAKLFLGKDEVPTLRQQLQDLLNHAGGMSPEDLAAVEAVVPIGALPVAPSSCSSPALKQEEVLALAADSEQGYIRVPRVLGDD